MADRQPTLTEYQAATTRRTLLLARTRTLAEDNELHNLTAHVIRPYEAERDHPTTVRR